VTFLALLVDVWCISLAVGTPEGWPETISGDSGFFDLGKSIVSESGFPITGSDADKARYVFSRIPEISKTYGLKPGTGGPLSNPVIGAYRTLFNDPENAECLKGAFGWGNCGEYSYAFSMILGGAGVVSRVVYADTMEETGHSAKFTGTDTTVIVGEKTLDGKVSSRVFDWFRAAYDSYNADHSGIPTDENLKAWGDIPLSDVDKLRLSV
jgi:hypothetical protein